jgi:hypothetical protein
VGKKVEEGAEGAMDSVGASVYGILEELEKQMMKPPSLPIESVDHSSCVPVGVALRFAMALNARLPDSVPKHHSLGAQSHCGRPGQMPEANPEVESSDGKRIFIRS